LGVELRCDRMVIVLISGLETSTKYNPEG
jgi:hypothetical protein